MDLQLTDKVAIVTGGASGIGAACVKTLVDEGCLVAVLGRIANKSLGELFPAIDSRLAERITLLECELTDEAQIVQNIEVIQGRLGTIDILVNNAGLNDGVGLNESTDRFRESLEANLVHVFVTTKVVAADLKRSRGSIVNIGSKCASTGQGRTSGYVAAKGAIESLTREWAIDFASAGVRVNCVIPAEVLTPLYTNWLATRDDPMGAQSKIEQLIPLEHRFTLASEIADTVVFLASSRSSHTTGQLIYVDGGYTHLDRAITS